MKMLVNSVILLLFISQTALAEPPSAIHATTEQLKEDIKRVHADAKANVEAFYKGDAETVISLTHPVAIKMMGGKAPAKAAIEQVQAATVKRLNMKIVSFTFPAPPTFIRGEENEFCFVPTLSKISSNGEMVESLNFVIGARRTGTKDWKYTEGSRLNAGNINSLFPDFPSGVEFPQFYRKKL